MENNEKCGLIHSKVIAIMKDLGPMGKDGYNSGEGFAYRSIEQVYDRLQPMLIAHEIVPSVEIFDILRGDTTSAGGEPMRWTIIRMRVTLTASDGSSVFTDSAGEGLSTSDKATSKAMSIGYKYGIFEILCIPHKNLNDPDSETLAIGTAGRSASKAGGAGRTTSPAKSVPAGAADNSRRGSGGPAGSPSPASGDESKIIQSKYKGKCKLCQASISEGDDVKFTPGEKGVACMACVKGDNKPELEIMRGLMREAMNAAFIPKTGETRIDCWRSFVNGLTGLDDPDELTKRQASDMIRLMEEKPEQMVAWCKAWMVSSDASVSDAMYGRATTVPPADTEE